jgi:hypothetical protein
MSLYDFNIAHYNILILSKKYGKMKKTILLITILSLACIEVFSQVAEKFNYQAIVRDSDGQTIINQQVSLRISILKGSEFGNDVYVETHSVMTNSFGMVSMQIGGGLIELGNFSEIEWGADAHYIKIEMDPEGNSNYTEMGTSQLLSVPYALYSNSTNNVSGVWSSNGSNVYVENTTSNVGIGTYDPGGKLHVKGDSDDDANTTLFEVTDKDGNTVFRVTPSGVEILVDDYLDGDIKGLMVKNREGTGPYEDYFIVTPDSVRIYIKDDDKGVSGGFAVGKYGAAKNSTNDLMRVSGDSIRMYIDEVNKGVSGGFAVGKYGAAKNSGVSYFDISTSNNADTIDPSEPRILWYPYKEAFLTGRVLIESADSIGTNSFASGFESKAIGDYSQAMGYAAIARGNFSTSIGRNSIAGLNSTIINAFSFGNEAFALDTNSVAIGYRVTASGKNSLAIGDSALADNINAIAIGSSYDNFTYFNGDFDETYNTLGPRATGRYSLAIGSGIVAAGDGSVVIGSLDTAYADYATIFGLFNNSTGRYTAIGGGKYNRTGAIYATVGGGNGNEATGESSVVSGGEQNEANYLWSTVTGGTFNSANGLASTITGGRGNHAEGNNSSLTGSYYSNANGDYTAILNGWWSDANDYYETVIGPNADPSSGNGTSWVSTDRIFTVANGSGVLIQSNALVILKNGNAGFGTNTPVYKLDVIGSIRATGAVYYGGSEGNTDGTEYAKPDFVFESNYKNNYPIYEIEAFIQKNKHLPWLTSAKDEGDAINMTRMSFETLEAVENMQLQIIQLKKENDQLKEHLKDIDLLKEEINKLKSMMETE